MKNASIVLLLFMLFGVACSSNESNSELSDQEQVELDEMKNAEYLIKSDQERLDSMKKANGITD